MDKWFRHLLEAMYLALRKNKYELRGYNVVPEQYNRSTQVALMKPCNGWTVINQGSTTVTVNGTVQLTQGEFLAVGGNEGEEYTGFLRLSFVSNVDPNNNVVVLQKFYTDGLGKYDKING